MKKFYTLCALLAVSGAQAQSVSAQTVSPPVDSAPAKAAPPKTAPKETISVPDILKLTSELRGLKVLRPVPWKTMSRAQVETMVRGEMKKKLKPQQLRGSELTLKTLGMMPQNFDLAGFYVGLLGEQVAGLYDPEIKSFVIADWADARSQKIIAIHELTHALQDQHYDIGRIMKMPPGNTDAQLAAMTLMEGDASLVMVEYLQKHPLEALALMGSTMMTGAGSEEKMNAAPRALREALIFPYEQGLEWVQQLKSRGGWAQVNKAYRELPLSTEHVLHLNKYLAREKPVAVKVPDVSRHLGKGWQQLDSDVSGEYGLYLTLDEHLKDVNRSRAASAGWGGDRYTVLEGPKGAACVVQMTVWDSPKDALEFFSSYARRTDVRYRGTKVQKVVWPRGGVTRTWKIAATKNRPANQIVLERRGNRVLALEGLPAGAKTNQIAAGIWYLAAR
jgi:hypothetical protein